MNRVYISFLLIVCVSSLSMGQNPKENKYFSIGTKTYGICFGNSNKYNGIRFSFDDFYYIPPEKVNGINLSLAISNKLANGIQIGIYCIKDEGKANGINVGGFGITASKINGLAIASIALFGTTLNGIRALYNFEWVT